MFSRSALRPLTVAALRSTSTHSARGAIQHARPGHPGKDHLCLLPADWLKGPVGIGVLAYICSGDFCARGHEHSGLSLGIMEDDYYSSGLTLGIFAAFAVVKLLPVIAKWADGKRVESGNVSESKVLLLSPPQEILKQENVIKSS
ncbi:ATP synthase subunit b, mitochondrial [Drosophila biarmipes]|uniref:ATP synthase subunit b, mitochondrial n=1 Tax=Drosophila biarmipes TaxID=125945 RepID=UPI0007E6584A|nr:ATP synthase subunit b, mitochondrial [Drosophila biarmipes]